MILTEEASKRAGDMFMQKLPMYVGLDDEYAVKFRILRQSARGEYGSVFDTYFHFGDMYAVTSCSGGAYDLDERNLHQFFENEEVRKHLKDTLGVTVPEVLPYYLYTDEWQSWFEEAGLKVIKV